MNFIVQGIGTINERLGRLSALTMLMATAVVIYDVIMRYAFNSPTVWGLELTIYLCGASYLLSGAYAELYDYHVRVDLFYSRMSPRGKAVIDVLLTAPIYFAGLGILAWYGWDWTQAAMQAGTTVGSLWNPQVWPIRALIPLGSLLLILQGVAKFITDVRTIITGETGETAWDQNSLSS